MHFNEVEDLILFFKYMEYFQNLEEEEKSYLNIAVITYYYYLIYYEDLASASQKESFHKDFECIFEYIEEKLPWCVEGFYNLLIRDLSDFEWYEEMEGKIVIIHNVIFEFLIFYSFDRSKNNFEEIFSYEKDDDFINFYNSKDLKGKYEKYSNFMKSTDDFEYLKKNLNRTIENMKDIKKR